MTTKTTDRKATHYGECQLCGREQMLPNGKLSLHGYTTRWGFFSGICPGSRELPYEQSADLLPPRRDWAAKAAKSLVAQAREERALRDPKAAWVHHYISSRESRDGHSSYEWRQVEIALDGYGRPGYSSKSRISEKVEWVSISVYDIKAGRETPEYLPEVAAALNAKKAADTERSANQHLEYSAWCSERFEAFKPRALKPVDPKVRATIVHFQHPKPEYRYRVLCSTRTMYGAARTEEQSKVTCTRCAKGISEGWFGIVAEKGAAS